MSKSFSAKWLNLCFAILLTLGLFQVVNAQQLGPYDKERGVTMLKILKDEIKKNYYDPNFHNINLDVRFKEAEEKVKQATSFGQIVGIVAQVLLDFNDSHTFFIPPSRSVDVDYGWKMLVIGDKCFVNSVRPGSDAETKGLKAGDQIQAINGYPVTRQTMWKIRYLFNTLRPQPGLKLSLLDLEGKARDLEVIAKITQNKQRVDLADDEGSDVYDLIRQGENERYLNRHIYYDDKEVFIWKMPEFNMGEEQVDDMMNKIKKSKSLILDLRGNPGGYEVMLLRLIGHCFDHDVKVGTIQRRKETKPIVAKTRGKNTFKGDIVVLIDSDSGSAAEVFAKVLQIEKRGKVVGDLSSGSVMRSRSKNFQLGMDVVVFYGASITDADLIMADGKSLEHIGVTPDETILPTAKDIASSCDPAFVKAADLLGIEISAEKAGKLFPIEWKK